MSQSPTHFVGLLPELTLEEKLTLLSSRDFSMAAGVARLGMLPIRVVDSICGIRTSEVEADIRTASFLIRLAMHPLETMNC
jgi:beta-glucosidase